MLTGVLRVPRLPPQSTFWRFMASLHLTVSDQILRIQRMMRERVWQAAHVKLKTVTLDTDTTVHTLFGHQMGGRRSYNPKNKGKKSYQPILTFLAETRGIRGGGTAQWRPSHRQTDRAPSEGGVCRSLPAMVKTIYGARRFRILLRRGCGGIPESRSEVHHLRAQDLAAAGELKAADWTGSPKTDADGQCEFRYRPEGWSKTHRFIALRYEKKQDRLKGDGSAGQYQLFDTPEYSYRVFVTNMTGGIALLTWLSTRQRAGRGEPHQGSQKRCRDGGPSFVPVVHELHFLSDSLCWPTT